MASETTLDLNQARALHRTLTGGARIAVFRAFAETPEGFHQLALLLLQRLEAAGHRVDEQGELRACTEPGLRSSEEMAAFFVRAFFEERDRPLQKKLDRTLQQVLDGETRADAVVEACYACGFALTAEGKAVPVR